MRTDNVIRNEGMKILVKHLGIVEAERSISLTIKEPFDYTQWQKVLWNDKTVKEISKAAAQYRSITLI